MYPSNKKSREGTLRTTQTPLWGTSLSTGRAPWRRGENAERSASLRRYYTIPRAVCQAPFEKFFRSISAHFFKIGIYHIFCAEISAFFLFCGYNHENLMQKLSVLDIYKTRSTCYNDKARSNRVALCTADHRLCGVPTL